MITRVRPDHRVRIGHEEIVEQVAGLALIQAVDRAARAAQMGVGRARGVGFELREQAWHEVDRAAELGNFFQVQRHPQVVLGGVQPDPGHGVFARDIVGVIRLMLVPHERQRNRLHQSPFIAYEGGRSHFGYSRYRVQPTPSRRIARSSSIARNRPGRKLKLFPTVQSARARRVARIRGMFRASAVRLISS